MSIEFSNSKLISNCGGSIFSREVGQEPAPWGLRSQWAGGSGGSGGPDMTEDALSQGAVQGGRELLEGTKGGA